MCETQQIGQFLGGLQTSVISLWTNPHHCSQSMERSAFTSCSQAASDKTSLLSKVASSPSTSDHFPEAPNLMPFSFCTTYFFRTSCRFLCMASTTLCFTPKMRWMEASGTRRITRSNKADWVWSDKASGPLPAWKSGCKYWGWILCWQALLLHRYFGLASLQWVCNVDKVPRLHLGQRLPDQSGKILSWISIFTMSMSEAFRSSGTTRRQWACSLRTPGLEQHEFLWHTALVSKIASSSWLGAWSPCDLYPSLAQGSSWIWTPWQNAQLQVMMRSKNYLTI